MKRLVVIKPYKEAILTHNNVSTVPFLKYLWFSDVISYLNVNVHKILKGALTGMEFIASVTRLTFPGPYPRISQNYLNW